MILSLLQRGSAACAHHLAAFPSAISRGFLRGANTGGCFATGRLAGERLDAPVRPALEPGDHRRLRRSRCSSPPSRLSRSTSRRPRRVAANAFSIRCHRLRLPPPTRCPPPSVQRRSTSAATAGAGFTLWWRGWSRLCDDGHVTTMAGRPCGDLGGAPPLLEPSNPLFPAPPAH